MLDYMANPKHKLTIGTTEFECEVLTDAKVTQLEDSFDNATITLDDVSLYTSGLAVPKAVIKLEVTNEGIAYPANPMFLGTIRFPIIEVNTKNKLTLSCLGAGHGLGNMLVAGEFGVQSIIPTIKTIKDIIADSANGIIPNFVNKKLGGAASGYTYDVATTVEAITGDIPYISFPYKPAHSSINDLVDLITAIKAPNPGCHWIVTTDGKFRLKTVGANQAGWTKYYGGADNTAAQATLSYGEDYESSNFELIPQEINTVVYYGNWRRPSNGDAWTEASAAGWGSSGVTLSIDNALHIVGAGSLKASTDNTGSTNTLYYPAAKTAAWDFTLLGNPQAVPTVNFYVSKHQNVNSLQLRMWTSAGNYFQTGNFGVGATYLETNDRFYHFSVPIGRNWSYAANTSGLKWGGFDVGTPDWANINAIEYLLYTPFANQTVNIDGLHFGSVPICRVATDSSISPDCMTLIVDDQGKDDSMVATDDSGIMAQLCRAELLRQTTEAYIGSLKTQMCPTALPGQLWHSVGSDFRATKLEQEIHADAYSTTLYLTDDLLNGRTRMRHDDTNKVYASIRPEWQDRKASNISAGSVDWTVPRLVKDYAP